MINQDPDILEAEDDQSWNLAENAFMHTYMKLNTIKGTGENSLLTYPADNMSIDGVQDTHCTHTPMSSGYSSISHNIQFPHYQQDIAGPSDLSMHTPSSYIAHDDYRNQTSSSNFNGNLFKEEDLFDTRVGRAALFKKYKFGRPLKMFYISATVRDTSEALVVKIGLRVLTRPVVDELPTVYQTLGENYNERVLPLIIQETLKVVVA
ncbi:prohibitin-1, mitochondrial-like protein isoform X1 [Tanacetum coccineum]